MYKIHSNRSMDSIDLAHFSGQKICVDTFAYVARDSVWRLNNEMDFQKFGNQILMPESEANVLAEADKLVLIAIFKRKH